MTQKEKQKYDIIIKVPVTRDQLEMIHQRMREAHTDNRAAFIRKMALDGYFLEMDTSPIKESNRLLRSVSSLFSLLSLLRVVSSLLSLLRGNRFLFSLPRLLRGAALLSCQCEGDDRRDHNACRKGSD